MNKNKIMTACLIILVLCAIARIILMIRDVIKNRELKPEKAIDILSTAAGAGVSGANLTT